MRFREWFLVNEIQHISLPQATKINGIWADGIDFRFEDWGKGYNPIKERNVLLSNAAGNKFFSGPFSAQINGGWLNVSEPAHEIQGNLGLRVMTKPQIKVATKPLHRPLPSHWFDFAVLYMGNDVVKMPEWPRDNHEQRATAKMNPVSFQHTQNP